MAGGVSLRPAGPAGIAGMVWPLSHQISWSSRWLAGAKYGEKQGLMAMVVGRKRMEQCIFSVSVFFLLLLRADAT